MIIAYICAFLAAFFWGAGFIGSRMGLESLGPLWVCFGRFLIAFAATSPVLLFSKSLRLSKDELKGFGICSICLAAMMFLQIKGLQYTTVAKSGFITILYAFITPIIASVFLKKRLTPYYWVMALCAFGGVCFLMELDFANLNNGDWLTLGCAVFAALHILSVGKYSKVFKSTGVFNVLQMLGVCIITLPLALIFEGSAPIVSFLDEGVTSPAFLGLIFMGIFSTAVAFFLQLRSQKLIEPHIVALVFLMESPLGAALGWIMLDEAMGMQAIIGCSVTLFAVGMIALEKPFQEVFANVLESYEQRIS
ncbi:MAG: DMT family transporter, partial [Bacteriovoracaceae bacterium]|nr:DMT family transporter [Bacteriovoracaceae bacterium]